MTTTNTNTISPADLNDEAPTVTGPRVKKLLTQPLDVGETLRVNPYSADMDLVGKYRTGGWQHMKAFRLSYPYRRGEPTRWKTCEELAAEIDAFLLKRADDAAAFRAKRRAEEAEAQRKADARAALQTELGAQAATVELAGGKIRLSFQPNEEGTGWFVDVFAGVNLVPLTTDEVRQLADAAKVTR